jgi:cytochrome oxidase assembly protein ShyY1
MLEGVSTRFWLRPKWVFGHILCLFLIVVFINCGFWQLRRLHQKQHRNDLIHQREQAAPASLDDALQAGADGAVYRRVQVEGRWDAADTVLVRSRSLNEEPGFHVLTPLVVGNEAVIVNRGFTPLGGGGDQAILANVQPPAGPVRVEGLLRATETRGSFGPQDPNGRLTVVNRIDVPRLQDQVDARLVPVYLQLTASTPAPGDLPRILPLPATDEGPHRAYAVQWFIFATVGAVGWPLLLRKTARDLALEGEPDEEDEPV